MLKLVLSIHLLTIAFKASSPFSQKNQIVLFITIIIIPETSSVNVFYKTIWNCVILIASVSKVTGGFVKVIEIVALVSINL